MGDPLGRDASFRPSGSPRHGLQEQGAVIENGDRECCAAIIRVNRAAASQLPERWLAAAFSPDW
jgi:hypothetical protein